MNASGLWRGRNHGQVGHFKFINVEVLPEPRLTKPNSINKLKQRTQLHPSCPTSVDDLLLRIGLKEYTSVFVLNG